MFVYDVYGLTVASEFELAGLDPGGDDPDVRVTTGRSTTTETAQRESMALSFDPVTLEISESRIVVRPTSDCHPTLVQSYILGVGLGSILALRGKLVLHASGITWDDSTIGFLAPSGGSKSTVAGMFADHGATVVTDDVLPVAVGDTPTVRPGPPLLKLGPDTGSEIATGTPVGAVEDGTGRQYYRFPGTNSEERRLDRLYLLEYGEETGVSEVKPTERAVELVGNTFPEYLLDSREFAIRNLESTTTLASKVPVKRLVREYGRRAPTEVTAAVRADLQEG